MLIYYLQIQTVQFMKSEHKMFIKIFIFINTKIGLIFSDCPRHSKFFDSINKKVIGKIKDEFKERVISEFIGLKLKMYSLIDVDDEEVQKAKGINKNIVKNIRHKEYIDVLFNKKILRKEFKENCTELEVMMFVIFHCLVLMIKKIYIR